MFSFEDERINKLKKLLKEADRNFFSRKGTGKQHNSHSLDMSKVDQVNQMNNNGNRGSKPGLVTFSKSNSAGIGNYNINNNNNNNNNIDNKSNKDITINPTTIIQSPLSQQSPYIDKVQNDKSILPQLNKDNKYLPLRNQTSNQGRVYNGNEGNYNVKVFHASGGQKYSKLVPQKSENIEDINMYLQENLIKNNKKMKDRDLFKNMHSPRNYVKNIKYLIKNFKNDDEINHFLKFVNNRKPQKVRRSASTYDMPSVLLDMAKQ